MTDEVVDLPLIESIKTLPGYDPYADCEGYYFNEKLAAKAIKWIEGCCTLTKGKKFFGKPFILSPWEKAVIANLFGWLSIDDGLRRYREVLIYIPRKNGKTELMAAINLYVLFCDGELGGEIYSAASNEKQAKIVWDVAKQMIKNNQLLMDYAKIYTTSITHDLTNSFYKYIPANVNGTHGANAHLIGWPLGRDLRDSHSAHMQLICCTDLLDLCMGCVAVLLSWGFPDLCKVNPRKDLRGLCRGSVRDLSNMKWWRRRESNPRPKVRPRRPLRA